MSSGETILSSYAAGRKGFDVCDMSSERIMCMDAKKKVLWMDVIKVFATLLIVIQHSISSSYTTLQIDSYEWRIINFIFMISRMGVPIFIMCSGAGMLAREHSVKEIWQKNILLLMKVYIGWMAVLGIRDVVQIWIQGENANLRVMINAFIKCILFGKYHTWFIFTLLGLYAITPLLHSIAQNKEYLCYFLVLSIIFTVILPMFAGVDWLKRLLEVTDSINMHFVVGYSLYFLTGYFIHTYINRSWERFAEAIFIISVTIAFVLSISMSVKTGGANQEAYGLFTPCGFLMSTSLMLLFKKHISDEKDFVTVNKIAALQKYGIAIYLMHIIFVEMWAKGSGLSSLIIAVLIWALSLSISMAVYRIPILNSILFIRRNEEKEQYRTRKEYVRGIAVALNCFAVFFMVYIIASSASYTVLLGDDFTHGVRVGAFHVSLVQYFIASLQYVKEIYLDWQGTYFAMFLQAFLSPINNFGLAQLRLVMIFNVLLFFAALFGMLWTASGFVLKENKALPIRLTIFSLVLFAILDAEVFTEIFFWYSGAVAYSIPFSFLILSIICFLLANRGCYSLKKKNIFTVCSAVLLFLASGGSLAVSGTGCYAVLLLAIGGGYISLPKIFRQEYHYYRGWHYGCLDQCGCTRELHTA